MLRFGKECTFCAVIYYSIKKFTCLLDRIHPRTHHRSYPDDDVESIHNNGKNTHTSPIKSVTVRKKHKNKNNNNKNKKVISIVGDSILKDIQGHDLSTDDHKVLIKSFSGATVNCMHHYIKPTMMHKPDTIIIHCGTNDLKKTKDTKEVAQKIADLAKTAQSINENTSVMISSLTPRNDRFKHQVNEVNDHLRKICNDMNIGYINHGNLDPNSHLNRSRLHLNRSGTALASRNFKEHISN